MRLMIHWTTGLTSLSHVEMGVCDQAPQFVVVGHSGLVLEKVLTSAALSSPYVVSSPSRSPHPDPKRSTLRMAVMWHRGLRLGGILGGQFCNPHASSCPCESLAWPADPTTGRPLCPFEVAVSVACSLFHRNRCEQF